MIGNRTVYDGRETSGAEDGGIDTDRSWIITTELNRFAWPGPDIRPTASGDYIYGYLPEKLMHHSANRVATALAGRRSPFDASWSS
jgi:hypothetical protein